MVLIPLVLVAPVMLLAVWVLALVEHGPVGWVAAAALLAGVAAGVRWCWRTARAWWASTKAPVRPPGG